MRLTAALVVAGALLAAPAAAVQPSEKLDDPGLEQRAQEVGEKLRCVVCQNQAIANSNADLAADMRKIVRERIKAGATNEEVIQYMQSRYGDYVLLNPPVKPKTYALWGGPAVLALIALGAVLVYYRQRRTRDAEDAPLSAEEAARADRLLAEDDDAAADDDRRGEAT